MQSAHRTRSAGRRSKRRGRALGREDTEVLLALSVRQCRRDLVLILPAALVVQVGQGGGVTLAWDNGADDALPGDAGDIAASV